MSQRTTTQFSFYLTNLNEAYPLKEVELNGGYILEFWFMESLENMFLTGQMTIVDTDGLLMTLPFTGDETLKVVMTQEIQPDSGSSDKDKIDIVKTIEFVIYNVKLKDYSMKKKTYEWYLIEAGAYEFMANNRSVGYTDKRISDIVTDVLKKYAKVPTEDFEVEKTNEILSDFTIPFWPPTMVLKHLSRKARRDKTPNEAGFLFYSTLGDNTRKKPFKKFVSFATLLEAKVDTNDVKQKYYLGNTDVNPYFINIIKEIQHPDYGRRSIIKDGIAGKRYFGIEYNTDKNIIEQKKFYSEFFNSSAMLGKVSYFPESIDDYHGEIRFFGGPTNQIKARQDYSFRMLLEGSNRRDIILEGSMERYVGRLMWIEQTSDNPEELYQKHDSGKWIIKTITHYVHHGAYFQKMVILKDSYNESDVKGHQTK